MPELDPIAPVVPALVAAPQQVPGSPAPAAQEPAGYVPVLRLTNALQKIEQLTLANRALADQSVAKDATAGQLQAKLSLNEAQIAASAGEHSSILLNLTKERDALKVEVAKFTATKAKIKLINDAKRPELYQILDSIPDAADEAGQKKIIDDLGAFAVNIASQREAQLVAGTIPGNNNPQGGTAAALPTSDKEWAVHLNALTLGSPERGKAMDQYFEWTRTPR